MKKWIISLLVVFAFATCQNQTEKKKVEDKLEGLVDKLEDIIDDLDRDAPMEGYLPKSTLSFEGEYITLVMHSKAELMTYFDLDKSFRGKMEKIDWNESSVVGIVAKPALAKPNLKMVESFTDRYGVYTLKADLTFGELQETESSDWLLIPIPKSSVRVDFIVE